MPKPWSFTSKVRQESMGTIRNQVKEEELDLGLEWSLWGKGDNICSGSVCGNGSPWQAWLIKVAGTFITQHTWVLLTSCSSNIQKWRVVLWNTGFFFSLWTNFNSCRLVWNIITTLIFFFCLLRFFSFLLVLYVFCNVLCLNYVWGKI